MMSKVEPSEDLPSADESAFVAEDPHQENGGESGDADTIHVSEAVSLPANMFMATPHGILTPVTAEQLQEAGIKTTHIVIHDETLDGVHVDVDALSKTPPATPLPPPTPSTPHSRERGFRYQWDESAYEPVLPIRCKNSNGEFHKNRFGSGGRGRCIKMDGSWYTPSEFEAVCGRASSKDWKRSIRYGGRTLACLIEDGILHPHATSCTCAACCDDEAVTGPVRLFVPYKRRKRDSGEIINALPRKKSVSSKPLSSPSPLKDGKASGSDTTTFIPAVMTLAGNSPQTRASTSEASTVPESIQILSASESNSGILTEGAVMIAPQPSKSEAATNSTVSDHKVWWQLEEMANNLLQQSQQLKSLIESAKHQCQLAYDNSIIHYKNQLEKEKNDALNAMRIEAQMQISRAVIDERAQKEIAVQQALAQARAGMQQKIDSVQTLTQIASRQDSSDKQRSNSIAVTDDKNTVVYLWPAQTQDMMDTTSSPDSEKVKD